MKKDTLVIGVAGYTGEMGQRHTRSIRASLDRLGISGRFYLYVRNPKPVDFEATVCTTEEEFYTRDYDLIVLAMHPQNRTTAYRALTSGVTQARLVFLEKPLWSPSVSAERDVFSNFKHKYQNKTVVNLIENYDPITQLLISVLRGDKANVPPLTIREILCHRTKDRESKCHFNDRHSEPLILQEGIHDVGFVMHILESITADSSQSLRMLAASAQHLNHPSGSTIPLAGSSYAMLANDGDVHVTIINGFNDPLRRKSKHFVCVDERGNNYNVYANYLYQDLGPQNGFSDNNSFEFRKVLVRNPHGETIYNAHDDETAQSIIHMDKDAIDRHIMLRILRMLLAGRIESNFSLVLHAERLCQRILKYQEYVDYMAHHSDKAY